MYGLDQKLVLWRKRIKVQTKENGWVGLEGKGRNMLYQRLHETGGKRGARVCMLIFLLASGVTFSYSVFRFVKANRILVDENPVVYRPMKKLRAALLKESDNEDIIRELREMDTHIRQRYAAARVDALRYFRTGLAALFISVVSARFIFFWRTRIPGFTGNYVHRRAQR